ncbi:MAG TPA: M36 family metallopeptidase [Actinoplanes sp.]
MKPLSVPSATRRWGAAIAGAVLISGMVPAAAQAAPVGGSALVKASGRSETRADFDSRTSITATPGLSLKAAVGAAPTTAAVRELRNALGVQSIVDIDKATGTPRRVARVDGYLTGASSRKPAAIALGYVKAHSDVFGLDTAAVDGLTLRQDYVDIAGTHHLSFVQSVGGVPVFGNGLRAHVSKTGRLIQVDGSPLADLPAAAGTAKLSAAGARAAAVKNVSGTSAAKVTRAGAGATRTTTFTDGGNAKLVYFLTATGPRLAWQTVAMDQGFLHVVDAATGDVLFRQNLVDSDSALAWTNYPGAPRGGTQRQVTLPPRWLPSNSPRLAGNVAHVYSDVNDDNVANPSEEVPPSGPRSFRYPFTDFTAQAAETGCTAQFKCSWDPKVPLSWETNREQNAVQLYYFLGTWHDHLNRAPIGFTRSAGNFEAVDGDAVQGQSDDGANTGTGELAGLPDSNHIDNANMNTPPDGTPPVMQMYLFHDPSDPTDPFIAGNSGDESDIVYHEYTHGLSNRLVVDANGVSTLGAIQAGAMGEAWSDWYAMDYLVSQGLERDTSTVGDLRIGKYVLAGDTIRSEPLDCPVGFESDPCLGTPGAGPGGYTYGDFGRVAGLPEVHADGEIWAQTLWDLRKAIGSKKAESLVTRAMELSPANPSFLDERNSILQADLVVNGGRLQNKIWKVFATRGMGFFAGATDGDDFQPVEDFSLPPAASTPRGSLTGTVTDAQTGAPLAGMTVAFGGHASGFAGDYAATTAADGTYTITGILPGTYAKVFARGPGYEPQVRTLSIAARTNTQNWQLRRDWAAISGGSEVVDFNGVDFTAFGCAPQQLFDLSQGLGWVTDANYGGDQTIDPRYIIVELPAAVDVTEVSINPANNCGVAGSASTGDYRVETSPDGTTWTVASQGHFGVADRVMHPVPLTGGTENVKFVRYTMLSTQVADLGGTCPGPFDGCTYVASTELAVFGPAAG